MISIRFLAERRGIRGRMRLVMPAAYCDRGSRRAYGAGRTSTAARSQRSAVGAVSLTVTVVPAVGVGAVWRWVQKVSPLGLRNWSTIVWVGPIVRAFAESQS